MSLARVPGLPLLPSARERMSHIRILGSVRRGFRESYCELALRGVYCDSARWGGYLAVYRFVAAGMH